MLTVQELMGNAPVSLEQYRRVEEAAIITARQRWETVRQLVSPIVGSIGEQRYSYDKLTEMVAAETAMGFIPGNEDIVNFGRTNVDIPVIQSGFRIRYRDLLSSQRTGTPLDMASAGSAGYRVGQGFADIITQGWAPDGSNYDIDGLYQAAGNDYGTTADFGTAGKAISAVAGGMALLTADNIDPPYHLSLNSVQYAELVGSVLTGGQREMPEVLEQLQGGKIFINNDLTAATGMMTATPEQGTLKVFIGQDLTTETWRETNDPRSDTKGRSFLVCAPVIYDANAICTLSSI